MRQSHIQWTTKMDAVVLNETPAQAAERLGVNITAVYARRFKLRNCGQRALKKGKMGRPARQWTAKMDAVVLKKTLAGASQILGLNISTVYERRKILRTQGYEPIRSVRQWTPEMDDVIAAELPRKAIEILGIPYSSVMYRRKRLHELGIHVKARRVNTWLTPDIESQLGKTTDAIIAQRVGVSVQRIQQMRTRLGIPRRGRKGVSHRTPK